MTKKQVKFFQSPEGVSAHTDHQSGSLESRPHHDAGHLGACWTIRALLVPI